MINKKRRIKFSELEKKLEKLEYDYEKELKELHAGAVDIYESFANVESDEEYEFAKDVEGFIKWVEGKVPSTEKDGCEFML